MSSTQLTISNGDETHSNAGIRTSDKILEEKESEEAGALYYNFVVFSVLYSITHACVDVVLAFSVAELGSRIGSFGGFSLYICYTLSALFIAKPVLKHINSKLVVLIGLSALLCYVMSFFVAIIADKSAETVFVIGSCIGGIGAGCLWTGQGSYYSSNCHYYAQAANKDSSQTSISFASVFAGLYLSLETVFKILATLIYLGYKGRSGGVDGWRIAVFGLYSAIALVAVSAFKFKIRVFEGRSEALEKAYTCVNGISESDSNQNISRGESSLQNDSDLLEDSALNSSGYNKNKKTISSSDIFSSSLLVVKALSSDPLLQLLVPFQLSFGFSAGFVEFYINGLIVKNYLGDGYIGLLSAITTLTAVALTYPFNTIAQQIENGKYYVMVLGGICFVLTGLPLLFAPDSSLGNFPFLIFYFMFHGCARGIWEGVNKAMVVDYFPDPSYRDVAYAAIYFTSGLSGAIAFAAYQFMSRTGLALLNTILPTIALITFHWSYLRYKATKLPS